MPWWPIWGGCAIPADAEPEGVASVEFYLIQLLNGLAYAMVLFVLAAGLSLVFGVGRMLNLAHGSFYMLGGYVGFSALRWTGNFWLALAASPLVGAALGWAVDRLLLRRFVGRGRELEQVLVTFGLAFILADLTRAAWGARILSVNPPAALSGVVELGPVFYPAYYLFITLVGLALATGLWALLRFTPLGVAIRATTGDAQMAAAMGISTGRVQQATFVLGAGLAALGGVLGAPMIALAPGLDFTMLILALIVVVVGGLGRVEGAFWAALLVGCVDVFGKLFFPRAAVVLIFALMAAVLAVRPEGLLGRRA